MTWQETWYYQLHSKYKWNSKNIFRTLLQETFNKQSSVRHTNYEI